MSQIGRVLNISNISLSEILTKEENRIFGDAIILINATVNNEKSIQYN
jgi:hypothetical protein